MANQNASDVQVVITSLRSEIDRQKKTLGYIGTVGRPDVLTNITQHQWVNPHLPIGWPTMPKGLVAKLITYVKKIVRRLLSWYIVPIVDQQNAFNRAVGEALSALNNNTQELAQRINMLENALAANPTWSTGPLSVDDVRSKARCHRLARAAERYVDLLRPYTTTLSLTDDDGDENNSVALLGKTSPMSFLCTSVSGAMTFLKNDDTGAMSIILVTPGQRDTLRDLNQLITLSVGKLAEEGLLLIEIEEKQHSSEEGSHLEDVRGVTWPAMFICSLLEKAGLPHTQVRFMLRHKDEQYPVSPMINVDAWSVSVNEPCGYAAFAYKET